VLPLPAPGRRGGLGSWVVRSPARQCGEAAGPQPLGASAPLQEKALTCPTRAPRVSGGRNRIGVRRAACAMRRKFRSEARKNANSRKRRAAGVSRRLNGEPPALYVFSQLAARGSTPQASHSGSRGSSDPREAAFFLVLEHPEGMPEGKTVLVSGTPAGVRGERKAAAVRWSPLRSDHRLQGWQAFGLLLLWGHSVLCWHAKHVPSFSWRRRSTCVFSWLSPGSKPGARHWCFRTGQEKACFVENNVPGGLALTLASGEPPAPAGGWPA